MLAFFKNKSGCHFIFLVLIMIVKSTWVYGLPLVELKVNHVPNFKALAPQPVDDSNIIKIGTMVFNPPFEMNNPQKFIYSGFEMDLMSEACRRIKKECQFVTYPNLMDLIDELNQGKVDMAVASIICFPDDVNYVFSLPYLPSSVQFFVQKSSHIHTMAEVANSRIGTTNDPILKTFVTTNFAKKYPITVYATPQTGIDNLASGNIDAFVMQTVTTDYWLSITIDLFRAVGESIPVGHGNSAVVLTTNSKAVNMIKQIDRVIKNMQTDGTYIDLYNRYIMQ